MSKEIDKLSDLEDSINNNLIPQNVMEVVVRVNGNEFSFPDADSMAEFATGLMYGKYK